MITELYAVKLSIELKSGARAEATLRIGDTAADMSHSQAAEVCKALRTAASTGDVVLYANIQRTTVDDNWKPS